MGISRRSADPNYEVILQMWTIPSQERLPGLTKQFIRGHRAAVIIIRPDEIDNLEELMDILNEEAKRNLLVILLGSHVENSGQIERAARIVGTNCEPIPLTSIEEGMACLSEALAMGLVSKPASPFIGLLDVDECPILERPIAISHVPPSTPEEVDTIRNNAVSLGYRCSDTSAKMNLMEGEIEIDLETGKTLFRPIFCEYCVSPCRKEANICIVAVDNGWASQEMGGLALLTLAKLAAFSNRELPEHVENQIKRACSCSEFEIAKDNPNMEGIFEELSLRGYVRKGRRLALLDLASIRVRNGNLSQSVFNTLRNSLKRTESHFGSGDGQ